MLLLDCKQHRDEEQFSSVLQGNIKNKHKTNNIKKHNDVLVIIRFLNETPACTKHSR